MKMTTISMLINIFGQKVFDITLLFLFIVQEIDQLQPHHINIFLCVVISMLYFGSSDRSLVFCFIFFDPIHSQYII